MGKGIYHGTGLGKNDFVIREHRSALWVDHLNSAGGTHLNISPARGYPTLQRAIEGAQEFAHTRGIRRYEIYREDGDGYQLLGNQTATVSSMTDPTLRPNLRGGRPPRPPPRPGERRPPPRQPAAVLRSVRQIAEDHERVERPFEPTRRYPRATRTHHFAVNSHKRRGMGRNNDGVFDEAVDGAARAFFVSAWADGAEEAGHEFAGGTQLEDVAPPTPPEATAFATTFIRSVEKLNGASISAIYRDHAAAPGRHEREPTPDEFGWYIAMPAMGHGVSWYDDHNAPRSGELQLPSVEFIVDVDPSDIDETTVNYAELSERLAH